MFDLPYFHDADPFLAQYVTPISNTCSPPTLSTSPEQSTDSADTGEGPPAAGSCSAKSKLEIDEYDLVAGSDLTFASHLVEE